MEELNSEGEVKAIIITCEADIHLVRDVLRARQPIFTTELVMSAVTRQEMDFHMNEYVTYL